MRFFLAIPLNPLLDDALDAWLQGAGILHSLRLVPRENRHCTIQFVGEITDTLANAILQLLGEYCSGCKKGPAEGLAVSGIGFFSSGKSREILWAGVEKSDWLQEFATGLATRLESLGIQRERREWWPHITLGRSSGLSPASTRALSQRNAAIGFGRIRPLSLAAYRSSLRPEGAAYTVLASYRLG